MPADEPAEAATTAPESFASQRVRALYRALQVAQPHLGVRLGSWADGRCVANIAANALAVDLDALVRRIDAAERVVYAARLVGWNPLAEFMLKAAMAEYDRACAAAHAQEATQ